MGKEKCVNPFLKKKPFELLSIILYEFYQSGRILKRKSSWEEERKTALLEKSVAIYSVHGQCYNVTDKLL